MTSDELAQHYTADELLAALCARMSPADAVAAVRAVAPFLSGEDKAVRTRRLAAERSKRSYDKKAGKPHASPSDSHASPSDSHGEHRQKPHGNSEERASDSHAEPSESGDVSHALSTAPAPRFPPVPPSFPASSPPAPPAYVRPTVEDAVALMNANLGCRIPPENRQEVAQAYIDNRERTDPPWHLPADHDRPARPVGANWQADCRTFCRNWQDVLDRNRAREVARNGAFFRGGEDRVGYCKLPDESPAPSAIDPALFRAFREKHTEYRDDLTQPKTESDIPDYMRPDWVAFKRKHATRK